MRIRRGDIYIADMCMNIGCEQGGGATRIDPAKQQRKQIQSHNDSGKHNQPYWDKKVFAHTCVFAGKHRAKISIHCLA